MMKSWDKVTGKIQSILNGSDGRLDVSARCASRSHYICRDYGELYSWVSRYISTSGSFVACLENTHSDRILNIKGIFVSAKGNARFIACIVTGTTAGGSTTSLSNHKVKTTPNTPSAIFTGGATVTGLTNAGEIGAVDVAAYTGRYIPIAKTVMLQKNHRLAIYCEEAENIAITIEGYYE